MGKSSPSPPDPVQTAQAQGQATAEAVRESARMNQIGINSPFGRQFYTGTIGEPNRALNIELNPAGQQALESQQQLTAALSGFGAEGLGPDVMARLGAAPGSEVAGQLFERSMGRLQPGYERREETLRSRLLNQGIPEGSRAWNQAMAEFGEQRDRTISDLALGSEIQGLAEDRAQRSQAINELSALLQGAPAIGQPMTQSPGQYGIAPPDIAGLTMANYSARLANAQQQQQGLGGLLNLGGNLGAAALMAPVGTFSDRRLKTDIKKVGTLDNGLPVYAYRFKTGGPMQIGLMAEEVEAVKPEAVATYDGYKTVDYGRAVE